MASLVNWMRLSGVLAQIGANKGKVGTACVILAGVTAFLSDAGGVMDRLWGGGVPPNVQEACSQAGDVNAQAVCLLQSGVITVDQLPTVVAAMQGVLAPQNTGEPTNETLSEDRTNAIRAEAESPDAARREALALLLDPKTLTEGLDRLAALNRQDEATAVGARAQAAAHWRNLGALAFGVDARRALAAYDRAAALAPQDFWTHIYRARLHMTLGNVSAARDAAERALAVAGDQRDRSVALNTLGDALAAAGDRAGALEAYNEDLAIARALAAKDPENTLWARDVSISLDKVGNMRAAAGDRAGALEAYQESLAIHRALAAKDPDNTQSTLFVGRVERL
ncbi:MAG: hypothetical protein ACFB2Z_06120 [Maricaulaceae bacterium]